MKDIIRLLATGYLVKRFLAPRVYPLIDQAIVEYKAPMREILPSAPKLVYDRGNLPADDHMIVDGVVYARRRD